MLIETSPMRTSAANRSDTITAGGVAQDFMAANHERHGWAIQNQSDAVLYVCSKGPNGTTAATQTQACLQIPIGEYYEAPHVDGCAWSIIGPTTGKPFWAEEW